MKKLSAVIGMLLVSALVFTMMFASAIPAGAVAEIHTVTITIDPPVCGAQPAYTAVLGGTGFTLNTSAENGKNGIGWYDLTADRYMTENETFADRHSYRADFFLDAEDDYAFASNVSATVNGYHAPSSGTGKRLLAVRQDFGMVKDRPSPDISMTTVTIDGFTAPVIGAHPDFEMSSFPTVNSAIRTDIADTVNGIIWTDSTMQTVMTAEDVFAADHSYMISMIVDAKIGATFNDTCTVTLGTHPAEVTHAFGSGKGKYIMVTATFDMPRSVTVYHVTDLLEPVAGGEPDYYVNVAEDDHAEIASDFMPDRWTNGVEWRDVTAGTRMAPGDKFEKNHVYTVNILVRPKDGYVFHKEHIGYINGEYAHCMDADGEYEGKLCQIDRTFDLTETLLGDIDGDGAVTIMDVTALQRHLAELETSSYHEEAADADDDKVVTIMDATAIQRYLANLSANPAIGKPIA